jgi:hypothetical protein
MNKKGFALQDIAAPDGVCFGCGPKNADGLQIKSVWDHDNVHVITTFIPNERYVGWPSLVYGGLIGCLVDCHSNWTAIAYHYRNENRNLDTFPRIRCVTGSLSVKYIKPTPIGIPLKLRAHVEGEVGRKTRILCELHAGDTLTALGDSIFVRVENTTLI